MCSTTGAGEHTPAALNAAISNLIVRLFPEYAA
jgi:hypothetical protein